MYTLISYRVVPFFLAYFLDFLYYTYIFVKKHNFMNTQNKKEEYNLSSEPQTTKKEWIKPESKVMDLKNSGTTTTDLSSASMDPS
jgi:uncharacterized protein YacL